MTYTRDWSQELSTTFSGGVQVVDK